MWGAGLSLGYVVTTHLEDMDWFVAVNPSIFYSRSPQVINFASGQIPYRSDVKSLTGSVVAPFYLKHSPATWVSIFGGIVYSYNYSNQETNNDVVPFTANYSLDYYSISYPSTYTTSYLTSSTSTFLGVDLVHPSGLRFQIKFGSSFATTSSWYISAGFPL